MTHSPPHCRRESQRGAAALMVVMVLFFVVSLVAAYASRNLIFEQRTSANQYRSTQAFEAAEAGLEWALGLLNSGRLGDACQVGVGTSFRERYINTQADSTLVPRTRSDTTQLLPTCVRTTVGWTCSCPSDAAPSLAVPVGTGPFPAFRVRFFAIGQPGTIRIESRGCTRLNETCLGTGLPTDGDAQAVINQVVALKTALSTPPAAALTVRENRTLGGAMRVTNTDPSTNGITVNAGGTVARTDLILSSVPGAPTEPSVVDLDTSISALTADRMFASVFGMRPSTYRLQPSALTFDCTAACSAADLRTLASLNPGRPIWVDGSLDMDSDGDLGSVASPVVLIVTGNLRFSAPTVRIYGLVYARTATWTSSGTALLQGAVIAEGNLGGDSTANVQYDADIIARLRRTSGSFVRVPGGWRDF